MPTVLKRCLALGAVSCVLASAPALAEPFGRSVLVRTADLDLASTAGERTLRSRLARAARLVCDDADPRDLRAMAAMKACRSFAMTSAAPQVESALAEARDHQAYAAGGATSGAPTALR